MKTRYPKIKTSEKKNGKHTAQTPTENKKRARCRRLSDKKRITKSYREIERGEEDTFNKKKISLASIFYIFFSPFCRSAMFTSWLTFVCYYITSCSYMFCVRRFLALFVLHSSTLLRSVVIVSCSLAVFIFALEDMLVISLAPFHSLLHSALTRIFRYYNTSIAV